MRCCVNCKSIRRPVYKRKYCGRCFTAADKLRAVEGWDVANPESLIGFPKVPTWRNIDYFFYFKNGFITQLRARLDSIRFAEEKYNDGVRGVDVEAMLREIARRTSSSKNVHCATRIDHSFSIDQKQELYRLLLEVVERIRWRGVDIDKILLDRESDLAAR